MEFRSGPKRVTSYFRDEQCVLQNLQERQREEKYTNEKRKEGERRREGDGGEEDSDTHPNVIVGAQENFSCWLPDRRINSEKQRLACKSHLCIVDDEINTIRRVSHEQQARVGILLVRAAKPPYYPPRKRYPDIQEDLDLTGE